MSDCLQHPSVYNIQVLTRHTYVLGQITDSALTLVFGMHSSGHTSQCLEW